MTTAPTSSLPIAAIPVERFVERLYAPLAWEATVRLGDAALASRLVERVLHRAWDERERFATFDALNRHVQDAALAAVAAEADRRRELTRFDHASPTAPVPGGLESMSVDAVQRRIGERRAPSPTPPQVAAVIHPVPEQAVVAPVIAAPAPAGVAPVVATPAPATARPSHAPRLSMSASRVDAPRPSAQAKPGARPSASVRASDRSSRKTATAFGGASDRFSTAQKQVGIAVAIAVAVIAAIALRGSGARDPETRAFAALSDTTGTKYEAARGTFEDLSLPDSSKARLGAGASLGTNAEFGDRARALRIAGPVELRLLSDSAKLVAIQAGEHRFLTAGAVAAFSISTGGQIAVQVDSGALVLVQDSTRVRLVAGSIVRVDTGAPASLSRDERDQAFGWRKGRLQLVGQPLSAIAASAKQWYDVDVQFPSGRAATDTASLDVPLAERDSLVLGLERALRATASVSGDRIVLQAGSAGAVSPRPVRRALPAPPALSLPGLPPLD